MPQLPTFVAVITAAAAAAAAGAGAASAPISGSSGGNGLVLGRTAERNISWGPCSPELKFNVSNPAAVCANLTVPLDYKNASSGAVVTLELLKWPAVHQPSRGSILFNPGGPGSSGRVDLNQSGIWLSPATSGHFDLIGFDPRGVANTIPFSCYNMTNPADVAYKQVLDERLRLGGNSSDAAMGSLWASTSLQAAACGRAPQAQAVGNFTGTALVARDMMSIVDALGEDGMLRFWGFSYGTVLGATVAAMFPDRIDKLVLDGVANPSDWYRAYEEERYSDTDATFRYFLQECIALGSRCPLVARRPNATVDDLERIVRDKAQELKYHPVPIPGGEALGVPLTLDYFNFKSLIFMNLYNPRSWATLAAGIDAVLATPQNSTALLELAIATTSADWGLEVSALTSIRCGERVPRHKTVDEFAAAIKPTHDISWIAGDLPTALYMACARWPYQAAERYLGDFRVKTKNPALLISAQLDPTSPLTSARNVSAGLEGSVLLQRAGPGHCSSTLWSICTYRATRDYFLHGRLPAANTTCEADMEVFSPAGEYTAAIKRIIVTLTQENAANSSRSSA